MKFQITANVDTSIVPNPEQIAQMLPQAFAQLDSSLVVEAVHVSMTTAGFINPDAQPPAVDPNAVPPVA